MVSYTVVKVLIVVALAAGFLLGVTGADFTRQLWAETMTMLLGGATILGVIAAVGLVVWLLVGHPTP